MVVATSMTETEKKQKFLGPSLETTIAPSLPALCSFLWRTNPTSSHSLFVTHAHPGTCSLTHAHARTQTRTYSCSLTHTHKLARNLSPPLSVMLSLQFAIHLHAAKQNVPVSVGLEQDFRSNRQNPSLSLSLVHTHTHSHTHTVTHTHTHTVTNTCTHGHTHWTNMHTFFSPYLWQYRSSLTDRRM